MRLAALGFLSPFFSPMSHSARGKPSPVFSVCLGARRRLISFIGDLFTQRMARGRADVGDVTFPQRVVSRRRRGRTVPVRYNCRRAVNNMEF